MTTYHLSSMTISYKIKQLFPKLLKSIEAAKHIVDCGWSGELDLESKTLKIYLRISEDKGWCQSSGTENETVKLSDADFNELVHAHQYNVATREYEERKYQEEQQAIEKIRKELFP
jgi:curli biogenesis system outer membrane secretion channel CsgG